MRDPLGSARNASPTPFQSKSEPARPNFFAKLLRTSKPKDAQQAIVNRLAHDGPAAVSNREIGEELAAFNIRGANARETLLRVWRVAVIAFLADNTITTQEAQYLAELRRTLGLSDRELQQVEEQLVHDRYREAAKAAIADDHVSASDREKLGKLAASIRLPADVADRILLAAREERLSAFTSNAIEDRRLSATEEADLYALARALDIDLQLDDKTKAALGRYSLLWRIENGQLPEISVHINLQRGEICHAAANATWMEMRTRTERINYGGPVASIRIMRGLSYRVGSVKVQRITRNELTQIDEGRVYVTNKRVIFDGSLKNTAFRLSSVLSFSPYSDGVALEKSSGRSPHLILDGDIEQFHAVLGAVLARSE